MDESTVVLKLLHASLQNEDPDVIGDMELVSDGLIVLNGRLTLTAEVQQDPGVHPSLAHCHVVAETDDPELAGRLDACIVGVNDDREQALANAVESWMTTVAGPVLSLAHGHEVLGAVQFDGSQDFGVPGCHGFVGPMLGRMFDAGFDLSVFQERGLFDGADAMAPPGLAHLSKVTLQAVPGADWRRNLEVDGHLAAHSDLLKNSADVAASQGIVSQFAVFHFADQPRWIDTRKTVDHAIQRFIEIFAETKDIRQALEVLTSEGVEPSLAHVINSFTTLAFGRAIFAHSGVKFSQDYSLIKRNGEIEEEHPLIREAIFARSLMLCHQVLSTDLCEAAKALSLQSPELDAINRGANAGHQLNTMELLPPIVSEFGTSRETLETAIQKIQPKSRLRHPY
jgi:hypothetical protein